MDRHKCIKYKFIDSFRFMSSSLSNLVSYLPKNQFNIVHSEFKDLEQEKIALLLQKGIFPYDFVDDYDKLNMTELPSKDKFYNRLNDSTISDEEYNLAKTVWNEFDIKDLGEYSDLYLKIDVLLLADVFQNFRTTCLRLYGLDPAQYYTPPGLSWDAMLKFTKVRLELLTDVDMLLFIEKGS